MFYECGVISKLFWVLEILCSWKWKWIKQCVQTGSSKPYWNNLYQTKGSEWKEQPVSTKHKPFKNKVNGANVLSSLLDNQNEFKWVLSFTTIVHGLTNFPCDTGFISPSLLSSIPKTLPPEWNTMSYATQAHLSWNYLPQPSHMQYKWDWKKVQE